MNSPKSIHKLLSAEKTQLAELITTSRRVARLDRLLQAVLDKPLTEHCKVAGFAERTLVICADTPVWASRLHYYVPALLIELKKNNPDLQGLKQIKIRVSPAPNIPPAAAPAPRQISHQAARELHSVAESTTDPALRQALLRLARRGET